MNGSPIIQARQLSKEFQVGPDLVTALSSVSLEVGSGEMVLLMGPSGSGKTTLLSLLGCLMSPTSGSIQLTGRPVDGLGQSELQQIRRSLIGFIFQSPHLFDSLTALENVELTTQLTAGRDHRTAAAEWLGRVGLGHRMRHLPGQMSGGERQRVAIARAMAKNPTIVLADEPTANLDWRSGQSVLQLLRDTGASSNRAIVIATHDPRLTDYAHRVVHLEDGRIVHKA